MKKYLLIILSFSFLLMSISCKKKSDKYEVIRSSKYKKIILECRKDIGFKMFQSDIPGLSLAVYLNNELVWSEGLGYANKELKVPVQPNTKFRIGGVSKLFTGALLASFIQNEELNMETPIREFYPELPEDKNQITLYHLLSNISGIRPPTEEEARNKGYQTLRKGISVFIEDSLLFNPEEYYFESDYGYDLIGATMERVTEGYFPKILKSRLTDTLKLETTEQDSPIAIIDNRSQCYDRNFIARTVRATTQDNRHRAASVGLLSSAVDIATLMNEYLHPTFFKKEIADMLFTPDTLLNGSKSNTGFGVDVLKDNWQRPLYMAKGTTRGGNACVIAYPKYDLVIAMASNLTGGSEDLPVFTIASKFIELLDPQPKNTEKEKTKKE